MKPIRVLTGAVALFAVPVLLLSESRTWTNTDGQTMEAEIIDVDGDEVVFSRDERTYNYPIAELAEEDRKAVAEWAREREETRRQAEARQAVARELEDALVTLKGSRLQEYSGDDLGEKRLFAFYYSAGWCGPCRRFTPDLVRFYNRARRMHPEFEIVFVSSDRDEEAMREYMREDRMKWPAIRYEERREIDIVNKGRASGIPNLVLMDGSGEVLSRSYVNGKYVGPRKVLEELEAYLRENKS